MFYFVSYKWRSGFICLQENLKIRFWYCTYDTHTFYTPHREYCLAVNWYSRLLVTRLVYNNLAPICVYKNNRRIWYHITSTSRLREVTGQLLWRHNVRWKRIVLDNSGEMRARWLSSVIKNNVPDSKVHGTNIGPKWVLSAPDGPHVGPMKLAIRGIQRWKTIWVVREAIPQLFPLVTASLVTIKSLFTVSNIFFYIFFRLKYHCQTNGIYAS